MPIVLTNVLWRDGALYAQVEFVLGEATHHIAVMKVDGEARWQVSCAGPWRAEGVHLDVAVAQVRRMISEYGL